jgi:hypothetical protein
VFVLCLIKGRVKRGFGIFNVLLIGVCIVFNIIYLIQCRQKCKLAHTINTCDVNAGKLSEWMSTGKPTILTDIVPNEENSSAVPHIRPWPLAFKFFAYHFSLSSSSSCHSLRLSVIWDNESFFV